jgi:hypothetical protein
VVYFATAGATAWLLAFPLISGATRSDEFTSPIRWVSDIIRFVGAFLPGFASTWIDGYARAPFSFLLLAGLVVFFNLWGMRIASRIDDRMGAIWRKTSSAPSGLPDDLVYRLRSSKFYIALHEGLKRRWAPAFFALLFVYAGLALVNRLLYNVLDVAGFTCTRSAETKGLARGETVTVEFKTSDLCKPTGIHLDGSGARYMVKVESVPSEPWYDATIEVPFGGFSPTDEPTWNQRILLGLGVPLRRELTRDWFRIVLRYGDVGGEEAFLDPDPTDSVIEAPIKPTREGELFIFVNDAVLGIPGLYDLFYRNNKGAAKLTVKRR